MSLVDDDHVVLGNHRYAVDRVDRQQRVVGHDDLRRGRLVARGLGEALARVGAAVGAEAFPGGHGHLLPGLLGMRRRRVTIAATSRLALVLGPTPQAEHLAAE